MTDRNQKDALEDDTTEPVLHLIEHRLPWLILGLIGGILTTIFSSQFEDILSKHFELVYFIPVMVYMADAVGTQTETIYIRNSSSKKVSLVTYLVKESLTGSALGVMFGIAIGSFAYVWFHSIETALTVGIAMFINVALAPITALFIPALLQRERSDPALGSGPFTTVLQDLISLLTYFLVASLIILR